MRVGTEDAVPFTRIGVRWRQASRSQGGCASCGLRVDSPLQKPAQGQSKQSRIPALQQEESTFHVGHRPNDKQEARPKTSTFLPRDRSSTPPQQGRGATPRPTALAAARPGPRPLGPVHTVGCVSSHVSVDSGATGAVLPQKTPERTRSVTSGCQARAPRAPGHGAESSPCRKDPERITRRQLWKELAPPPPRPPPSTSCHTVTSRRQGPWVTCLNHTGVEQSHTSRLGKVGEGLRLSGSHGGTGTPATIRGASWKGSSGSHG